jgi:hypothetical protein
MVEQVQMLMIIKLYAPQLNHAEMVNLKMLLVRLRAILPSLFIAKIAPKDARHVLTQPQINAQHRKTDGFYLRIPVL